MGKIEFYCTCGEGEHEERIDATTNEKKITCSTCGNVYFTGSALKEIEKANREQAATK
jgi:uncharacterized protein with PIN domain